MKKFIFLQRCIPWRVSRLWNRMKVGEWWLCFQMSIVARFVLKDVSLEHVYTGGFNGDNQFDYAHTPPDRWHPNYMLKESPHVKFLQQFKDSTEIDNEAFKKSAYFRYALKDIRIYGDFFDNADEDKIVERANEFLKFYRAVKNNTCGKNFMFFPGDAHPKDCFIKVSKIKDSEYYLIREGHHRLAIYYVLRRAFIKARVIGKAKISLKEILSKQAVQNEVKKSDE
ncbi:hypothetical protein ACFL49_02220 [Candidatus Omnitrophota bacterium]